MLDTTRWQKLEGDEAAHRVVEISDSLANDVGAQMKSRWFLARTKYEGRPVTDETSRAADVLWSDEPYNLSRSAVDTAHAEIAARQRPKPMFVTTNGDWRTKRKAKKIDRFVEGCLSQRQGDRYSDCWELTEDCFRDAECAVGGVVKVGVDRGRERITYERVPAYEILVDPLEARGGHVRNWFHCYTMDLDVAEATFADDEGLDLTKAEREAIRVKLAESAMHDRVDSGGSAAWRSTQSLKIYEAWWISPSKSKPGKHVFACKAGMLLEEDWTWPRAPFAIQVWSKEPFGIWGTGLVEDGAAQHDMVNDQQRRLHNRLKLNAHRRTYYVPGIADDDAMKANDEEVFVPVKDMGQRPQSEDLPPISPAEAQMVETDIQRYYDFRGISQMSASQRKDPGVDAAIAMQTLNDIKSVRFMPKARAYELLYVDIGELTVYAARDLAKTNPSFTAKWLNDRREFDALRWQDIDIDDTPEVRVAPVSAMSKDPAQRLQIVEQITNMGFLSREDYFDLIGMPDLDSVLAKEGAERTWVEKMCDRYLDAEDDAELEKLGGYDDPDGYLLQPLAALVVVGQHYFEAKVNEAPDYNIELLIRFMASLQRIIKGSVGQQAAANAAPAQPAQAMAAPAPIPTPGAEPMGMAA